MMKKVLCGACALLMSFCFFAAACEGPGAEPGTDDSGTNEEPKAVSYSEEVESIEYLHLLTGADSPNQTDFYTVGGCDLGFPCYNSVNDTMYMFFGDTFTSPMQSGRWRSNTIARSTDYNLSDGLTIDDFITSSSGIAIPAIDGHHVDLYEITKIPTGIVEVGGTMYMYYFSKYSWNVPAGESMNYGGAVKSTDNGLTWERVYDMTWVDHAEGENIEQIQKLVNEDVDFVQDSGDVDLKEHEAYDFTQIFPKDGGDGYIYIYGEGGYRSQGLKLARVKKENIEVFAEYEYMTGYAEGQPVWVKGRAGLDAIKDNPDSFVIKDTFGEMSVMYNAYLEKWMLFTVNGAADNRYGAVYYTSDTPYGPFSEEAVMVVPSDSEVLVLQGSLYAPMTHEKWQEQNGKVFYIVLSVWMPVYNPSVYRVVLK